MLPLTVTVPVLLTKFTPSLARLALLLKVKLALPVPGPAILSMLMLLTPATPNVKVTPLLKFTLPIVRSDAPEAIA